MSYLPYLRRLLLGSALAVTGSALAQTFGFAPTVIQINSEQTLNSQTTVYNLGSAPARFTVTPKVWSLQGGQTVLEDTRDIIVNPTEFTIPPGGQQIIRMGLRKKPGADELTYRLQVRQQELPNSDDASVPNVGGTGTSLNLVLSFSLPVYIAPSSAAAKISYAVTRDTGDLLLKMTNAGNRHETYNNFVAERGGRQATLNSWAVLKDSDVTVRLSDLGSATGPLTLSFTNARGEKVHETLALP